MKIGAKTVGILLGVVALLATFQYGYAASESAPAVSKIGIVSVRTVFNTSTRHAQYRSQVLQAQSRARAQLDSTAKEIEAEEAGLKALKEGTADYMKQLQAILKKRADLESQREYLKQQRSLEDKNWMEALYQETLKIVQVVAKEKGLTLVFERTEPEFPVSSEELMMTFSTHKVLYAEGCVDLTQEVAARLDAAGGAQSQK
ncbi:MAG: OmpH family outer membrane protein [Planctomycetaceae bacterium]|nr:MAG: OmpH family outer membrane protein [Planctomycetaceae bacterium]